MIALSYILCPILSFVDKQPSSINSNSQQILTMLSMQRIIYIFFFYFIRDIQARLCECFIEFFFLNDSQAN